MTDNNQQPATDPLVVDAAKSIAAAVENFPALLQTGIAEMKRQFEGTGKTLGQAVVALHETVTRNQSRPPVTRENPGPWPYDELARQEWPHVPLQLARAYADEYVLTGKRP